MTIASGGLPLAGLLMGIDHKAQTDLVAGKSGLKG